MVQLACSCLNIRLHVQETADSLVAGIPNLTPVESQHPFFLKGACPVTLAVGGITEGQKFLVRRSHVGGWTVLECLNCHLLTHAVQDLGQHVAASSFLISDANKLQMLQRSDRYSPVFNLLLPTSIDNRPLPPLSPTDFPDDRSPAIEAALGDIQQQMSKFLKKAQSQVEANIRSYTDQQQATLHALQIRARRDRQTIMRLISNMQANLHSQSDDELLDSFDMDGARGRHCQTDSFSVLEKSNQGEADDLVEEGFPAMQEEPNIAMPPLVSRQSRTSQPMTVNTTQGVTAGMRNMRLSASVVVPRTRPQGNVRVAQSLDVEGLFDMDGMAEGNVMPAQATYHSDEEDTDDSNPDEGIHIPGGRTIVRDLAQSVPVSVPMWPNSRPKPLQDSQVIERPSDTHQMAASIKALARSVHTSSVDLFGDLPRPRQPL